MTRRRQKNTSANPLAMNGSEIMLPTVGLQLVETVSYNVRQDVIVITRDKVELCLTKHVKAMEQRQAWLIPFSVCLAATATLVASSFHDCLGLKAEVWHALFMICAAISFVWCGLSLIRRQKSKTINDVIEELRAQGIEQATETVLTETTTAYASTGGGPLTPPTEAPSQQGKC